MKDEEMNIIVLPHTSTSQFCFFKTIFFYTMESTLIFTFHSIIVISVVFKLISLIRGTPILVILSTESLIVFFYFGSSLKCQNFIKECYSLLNKVWWVWFLYLFTRLRRHAIILLEGQVCGYRIPSLFFVAQSCSYLLCFQI